MIIFLILLKMSYTTHIEPFFICCAMNTIRLYTANIGPLSFDVQRTPWENIQHAIGPYHLLLNKKIWTKRVTEMRFIM